MTEERKKLFDFSSYRVDQLGWLVQADSGLAIDEAADIAGLTVGVGSGTNQEQILLAWDAQNQAAGLDPVTIDYYESYNDAVLALQSGRLDTYFGPERRSPPTAPRSPRTTSRSPARSTAAGPTPPTSPSPPRRATAWPRRSPPRCNHAIDDGSYAEVLDRWGLAREAIDRRRRPTRPAWAPDRPPPPATIGATHR